MSCDDYVELVKTRGYGDDAGAASARCALRRALGALQRLLAPHIPFSTDEVWSWWHDSSIHASTWPTRSELLTGSDPVDRHDERLDALCATIGIIRRTKTESKVSQRAQVAHVAVSATKSQIDVIVESLDDLRNAGAIETIEFVEHEDSVISASVRLAETA